MTTLVSEVEEALGTFGLSGIDVKTVSFKDKTYQTSWVRFCEWFADGMAADESVIKNLQIEGKGWVLENSGDKWLLRSNI